MRLYEEMQRQGYRGGQSTGLGSLTQLRKAQGRAPRARPVQPGPPVIDPSVPGNRSSSMHGCSRRRQARWRCFSAWRKACSTTMRL
jgi:hypothetical protein